MVNLSLLLLTFSDGDGRSVGPAAFLAITSGRKSVEASNVSVGYE